MLDIQYAVTTKNGDRYYAKGDSDFAVIDKIFSKRDSITARNKGIEKITQYVSEKYSHIVYQTLWRLVK